jgi:hypothetical protein
MENIKVNKIYRTKYSAFKIVKVKNCKNTPCYHIKLSKRWSLFWGNLGLHYTLEEAMITIPNLLELDLDNN